MKDFSELFMAGVTVVGGATAVNQGKFKASYRQVTKENAGVIR